MRTAEDVLRDLENRGDDDDWERMLQEAERILIIIRRRQFSRFLESSNEELRLAQESRYQGWVRVKGCGGDYTSYGVGVRAVARDLCDRGLEGGWGGRGGRCGSGGVGVCGWQ